MQFNQAQQQAILQDASTAHCLVLAGAGSGKTAVLVHRLIHLLKQGYGPIWCITFTRKSALEMRERFGELKPQLNTSPELVKLETFHIFAREVLHSLSHSIPDDLEEWIPLATELLKHEPNLELPQAILVDEFQDINPEQLAFCQALRVKHLFAVGDDDQAIYGFRGSTVEAILNLKDQYSPLDTIYLNFNYRSRQSILDLANELFPQKGVLRKRLLSDRPIKTPLESSRHKPKWKTFTHARQQNDWLIGKILYLRRKYPQLKYQDFAILVRLNQLVEYYQEMLEFEDLPHNGLINEGIQVMTVHASKGLQFPIVFICDLNDKIFPHFEHFTHPKFETIKAESAWRQERLREEERLFYVAITRAESYLYLLHCKRRVWRGQWMNFKPSPFYKLRHTRRYQMVTWLKLRCFFMVNLFMFIRMIMYIPVVFQGEEAKASWIKKHSKIWARFVLKYLNFDLKVEGEENHAHADGRHLFVVSNHISWGDIPSLLYAIPHNLGFVAKVELTRIPILHYWMRQIGCIFVNRKKHREAMRALQALEEQDKFTRIVLFPEGTRSKNGKIGALKPGGLKIAWALGALIQPVHISGTRGSWEGRTDTAINQGTIKVLPAIDLAKWREEGGSFDEFLVEIETILQKENGDI